MGLRWLVIAALASGCVQDELVACGDQLCPIGYSCDTERSICALPNGLSIPHEISIESALCGQLSQGSFVVRNLGTETIPFDTILTDVGVTTVPASGSFPPGDTEVKLFTTVPLDSLPGHLIEGSLLLPVDNAVLRQKLRITPTGAALDLSTLSLSFGETSVATVAKKTITYANTGNAAVDLAAKLAPGPFTFPAGSSLHLAPGDVKQLEVHFISNSVQAYTSELDVTPDAVICQPPLDPIPIDGAATTDAILLDSLRVDFGDATCGQNAVTYPLVMTNTNASSQDFSTTIMGTNAGDFSVTPTSGVLAGNQMQTIDVTRSKIDLEPTGTKNATLAITAILPTLTTNKQVTLIHNVVGSELVALSSCVDLGGAIPPHTTVMGLFEVGNAGNATGPLAVTTAPNTIVSPSQFQLPPSGSVSLTYLVSNNSSLYVDPQGLQLGIINASNNCSDKIMVMTCGTPP